MQNRRRHRGAHPEDPSLFASERVADLRRAVGELSWLLSRGYADPSALKLVGDRHRLDRRQRMAVLRSSCSDAALTRRAAHRCRDDEMCGQELWIDGYNVLTTVETALGGGVVLRGRDRCCRDIAGLHGTWRRVVETEPALRAVGARLAALGVARCRWLLDRPVSNSGRLRACLEEIATRSEWDWEVDIVLDPDPVLAAAEHVVATSDSQILDRCARWFPLAGAVVDGSGAWIVDVGTEA